MQSLADVLMKAGAARFSYNSPWYEPEVTKARTVAAVTLSNNPHVNPNPEVGEVDVLVCMTPQMYFEKRHFVKKGGLVVIDNQGLEIKENGFSYTMINVPATSIATTKLGERRSANIVLLGVVNQVLEIFKDETLEEIIRKSISKAAAINIQAYRAGRNYLLTLA